MNISLENSYLINSCNPERLTPVEIFFLQIVQKYKVEYHHGTVEPVLNIVMNPERPLLFSFTPRE